MLALCICQGSPVGDSEKESTEGEHSSEEEESESDSAESTEEYAALVERLKAWEGGLDAEALQSEVFAVGKAHGFDPLRNWFTALYQVLLGADQGPRFGGFIALYGIDETISLLEAGVAGALVTQT